MNLALMRRHDRRDLRKNHTKTGAAKCRRESKFQLRKRGKIVTLVISSGSTAAGERPRSGAPQSTMVAPESDGGRKRVAAVRAQALMNSERANLATAAAFCGDGRGLEKRAGARSFASGRLPGSTSAELSDGAPELGADLLHAVVLGPAGRIHRLAGFL